MPLMKFDVIEGRTDAEIKTLLDAAHSSLGTQKAAILLGGDVSVNILPGQGGGLISRPLSLSGWAPSREPSGWVEDA